MKTLIFYIVTFSVIIAFSLNVLGAGGNAPAAISAGGLFPALETDSTYRLSDTTAIDSMAGDDSVLVENKFYPEWAKGYEYIYTTGTLSGDDGADSVCEMTLQAYTENDSMISRVIVDTFAAAGSSILIPFGQKHGYFGTYFKIYIKSLKSGGEIVLKTLVRYKRRASQIMTIGR